MPEHPRELVVLHYHFRAGGVRRVIELLLPRLAGHFESVTLLGGERPDAEWERAILQRTPSARFAVSKSLSYLEPGFNPVATQRKQIRHSLKLHIKADTLVWAHNLALGRNILLSDEMAVHSAATGASLLSHHHDFWCDRRWARWPEMRACGFRSLERVSKAAFAAGARVVHAGINSCDTALLSRHLPGTAFLHNPWDAGPFPEDIRRTRSWLAWELGDHAPVWLYPARFLRRKNFAEAVLLTRWLNPDGWLVTTGGVSSCAEEAYAGKLLAAAARRKWKTRFGVLDRTCSSAPTVAGLMGAAESLVMTSVQEGFGFPYLEGAVSSRRLIARSIPQIQPDLDALGVELPGLYPEVWIPSGLLNLKAERSRQNALIRRWLAALPSSVRHLAEPPRFLEHPSELVAFSRLTLDAQIEILSIPPAETWAACLPVNPTLSRMSACIGSKRPEAGFLSPEQCAGRLLAIEFPDSPPTPEQTGSTQLEIIRERLESRFFFPILLE